MLYAKLSGVYMILNIHVDGCYVGSAARVITSRWAEHRYALRRNKSRNPHLQNAWNKYGEDSFVFVVLENCPPEDCLDREEFWFQKFKSEGKHLYNVREHVASQLGFKHAPETVKRFADKLRGKKHTPERREAQRRAMFGVRPLWLVEANAQDWLPLVSPDGSVRKIHNLNSFCDKHALDVSAMRKVALGYKPVYKGWRLYTGDNAVPFRGRVREYGKNHTLVSPDGTTYNGVTNLEAFCREHDLDSGPMREVCVGNLHHHRGWRGFREGYEPKPPTVRATKDWPDVIGPDGQRYHVENLYQFCRTHGLDKGAMQRLYKGQVHTHKGWHLP